MSKIPNPKALRSPDMNEEEKRQGTLIFFIVESLLTAFLLRYSRGRQTSMSEIPYFC